MVQTLSSHHHSSNDWECWKYECVDEHRLLVHRTTMPQRLMMGRVHWTLHGHPHDDRGLHHGPVVGCEIGIDHGHDHDHDHVNGIENESEIFLLISLTTTKRCQKKDEGWEPDEKERRQEWRRAQTRRHNTSTNNERGGTSTNTSTNTMTVVAIESEPQPPFR